MKLQSSIWKNRKIILSRLGEVSFDKNGVCDKEISKEDADHLIKSHSKHLSVFGNPAKPVASEAKASDKKAEKKEEPKVEVKKEPEQYDKAKDYGENPVEVMYKGSLTTVTGINSIADAWTDEEKADKLGAEGSEGENGGEGEGDEKQEAIDKINAITKIKDCKELASEYPEEEKENLKTLGDWKNYLISKL